MMDLLPLVKEDWSDTMPKKDQLTDRLANIDILRACGAIDAREYITLSTLAHAESGKITFDHYLKEALQARKSQIAPE